MANAFHNPKLENKYNEKIKERKQLLAKRKQTNLKEEKVTINKRIEEPDSEIEEIKKTMITNRKEYFRSFEKAK